MIDGVGEISPLVDEPRVPCGRGPWAKSAYAKRAIIASGEKEDGVAA